MAYTDSTLTIVKKVHISELADHLTTLAKSKSITLSVSTNYDMINSANITAIQTAVNTLEAKFSSNCCQANCCQTQCTQTCQSSKCQSCQGCQKCQTCQSCQKNCSNCDC